MEKKFYSIAEVSTMLGISQSNLRFWEKEFKQLSPQRNKGGTRFYSPGDITVVKQIMFLVNEQKLTLDGARQRLNQKKETVIKQQELVERLKRVRSELKGLLKMMDTTTPQ